MLGLPSCKYNGHDAATSIENEIRLCLEGGALSFLGENGSRESACLGVREYYTCCTSFKTNQISERQIWPPDSALVANRLSKYSLEA